MGHGMQSLAVAANPQKQYYSKWVECLPHTTGPQSTPYHDILQYWFRKVFLLVCFCLFLFLREFNKMPHLVLVENQRDQRKHHKIWS